MCPPDHSVSPFHSEISLARLPKLKFSTIGKEIESWIAPICNLRRLAWAICRRGRGRRLSVSPLPPSLPPTRSHSLIFMQNVMDDFFAWRGGNGKEEREERIGHRQNTWLFDRWASSRNGSESRHRLLKGRNIRKTRPRNPVLVEFFMTVCNCKCIYYKCQWKMPGECIAPRLASQTKSQSRIQVHLVDRKSKSSLGLGGTVSWDAQKTYASQREK